MARDYPRHSGGSEEVPVTNPRALRHRYHSRAELCCWQHSFPAAAGDGGDMESRTDASGQSDCCCGDAQGRHTMVFFAGARHRKAAAVVALVGNTMWVTAIPPPAVTEAPRLSRKLLCVNIFSRRLPRP